MINTVSGKELSSDIAQMAQRRKLLLIITAISTIFLPIILFLATHPTRWFPSAQTQPDSVALLPPMPRFTDVDENGWAWKYIQQIVELNIMPPTSAATFNPTGNVIRADIAEFLTRTYELVTNDSIVIAAHPFTDITSLSPSQQEAIAKLYTSGITAGTSATTFSPEMEINRAQMATFLSNLYKAVTGDFAPEVPTPFTDIGNEDISWAQKPIARIYGLGITAGISPTEFGPYLTVTREQMATFIYNFLRLFPHSRNDPGLAEEIRQIRSITFYETFQGPPSQYVSRLTSELESVKQTGFNTVWLVLPWKFLNPKPLATPPEYSDAEFTAVTNILDQLKSNNMKAIIGLDYLGKNWSPEGIDYCTWLTDPVSYSAFERYSTEFLSRISNYSDMTYTLFFTENSEPCGLDPYGQAKLHAYYLRHTLGSLPSRLPRELRDKFKIGYHDHSLVNLDWAKGESPILLPHSFDFVSMALYDQEGKNETEISSELKTRADRFRRLFPQLPLLIGETGVTSCFNRNGSPSGQARNLTSILSLAQKENLGFNLWEWQNGSCTSDSGNASPGLGLITKHYFEAAPPKDRFTLGGLYVKALLNPISLTDVDQNGWSWKYIQRILQTQIMPVVSPSEFIPQGAIRRVEMAEFLSRTYDFIADYLLNSGVVAPIVPTPFTDIGHLPLFQQEAIAKIYGLGVTAGTPATIFSPEIEINRAQMATLLSNLYKAVTGSFAPEVPVPFTDIDDIDNKQDIARIYGLGVTAGTSISPPLFSPHLIVTREQMATFIMNFIEKLFSAPLTMVPLPTPTLVTVLPSSSPSPSLTTTITPAGGFAPLFTPIPVAPISTILPPRTSPSPSPLPSPAAPASTAAAAPTSLPSPSLVSPTVSAPESAQKLPSNIFVNIINAIQTFATRALDVIF